VRKVAVRRFPLCDFCAENGTTRNAHYEGPTRYGPHATMCEYHHKAAGIPGSSITIRFQLAQPSPFLPGMEA
jgi:hypothetical protein